MRQINYKKNIVISRKWPQASNEILFQSVVSTIGIECKKNYLSKAVHTDSVHSFAGLSGTKKLIMTDLTKEQIHSVKKSYLNLLGFFLGKDSIESRYLRCLLKWGFQLHLNPEDLKQANIDLSDLKFSDPEKLQKLEAIYHLVYMIYLDKVVEDVELEVATIFAERLGFKGTVVRELFHSIATADYDQSKTRNVRQEVMDFLKVYES
jgi:hypothetical protein